MASQHAFEFFQQILERLAEILSIAFGFGFLELLSRTSFARILVQAHFPGETSRV